MGTTGCLHASIHVIRKAASSISTARIAVMESSHKDTDSVPETDLDSGVHVATIQATEASVSFKIMRHGCSRIHVCSNDVCTTAS